MGGTIFKLKETSFQGKKNKTSFVVSTARKGGNQVLLGPRISVDPVYFNFLKDIRTSSFRA